MADPGYAYLYSKGPQGVGANPTRSSSAATPPSRLHSGAAPGAGPPAQAAEAGHALPNGQLGRWEAALCNIEDARVALDSLAHAVDDAVSWVIKWCCLSLLRLYSRYLQSNLTGLRPIAVHATAATFYTGW